MDHLVESKVSSEGEATLPKEILQEMGVQAGDSLVFEVEGRTLIVRKAEPFDAGWHRAISATLAPEWDSPYDHENFDDL